MYYHFYSFFIVVMFFSCNPVRQNDTKVSDLENTTTFNPSDYGDPISTISIVRYPTNEDKLESNNKAISGVSIELADKSIDHIIGADDVVLNDKKVQLVIDYPLKKMVSFILEAQNGFTLRELIFLIQKKYLEIYKDEEESATIKTLPMDKRVGLSNRNETNSKYGIWGHDLIDLYLTDIEVYKNKSGLVTLILYVDS
jgi:hypothetical protein